MKRAWIRKVKGSRFVNAVDALSCEENDSPLCFFHSVPRLVSRPQMGGLSLTKIFCNARVYACSIEDGAVRTRASSSERRLCNVKTSAWPNSVDCRVRSTESTTLCTRCKIGGGVSGCFADWSVACQVLLNSSRRASCSSRLVACRVNSRAETNKRTPKLSQRIKQLKGRTRRQE